MRIALVPIQTVVADIEGNAAKIQKHVNSLADKGVELAVFPELALLGYLPQDLLFRPDFRARAESALCAIEKTARIPVLLGTIKEEMVEGVSCLFNSAVLAAQGERHWFYKSLIPAYDVFHEGRYFVSQKILGRSLAPVALGDERLGVVICEDSWHKAKLAGRSLYAYSPAKQMVRSGASILINISASPYEWDKAQTRLKILSDEARENETPFLYVNHFGAQDELVFGSECFAFSADGLLSHKSEEFSGKELIVDTKKLGGQSLPLEVSQTQKLEALRQAIVTGIRDYAQKNRFQKAVLGLSGGIDSALVAVLAAEALGPENVISLSMPSKFSSSHSMEDAEALAQKLGIKYKNFPIKFIHSTLLMGLKPYFGNLPEDVTEENLQARIRGVTVMAFSNKFRALALATGNKSEFSVGYSTLYGDTCGALAPIGDLYKTQVYELARFINKFQEIIPQNTLDKPPSAELKPGQRDQDTLPPYDVLDAILYQLIEEEQSVASAAKSVGQPVGLVEGIAQKLQNSEFKRRQCPPIIKVSSRAFGMGRRYPITGKIYA